ncbi:antibiotic biosynthesis monooxygenase [Rhodococcus sp. M8]|nr:antibiotic biosynthesis monooxygenase [Rhodococcus sp. M8]
MAAMTTEILRIDKFSVPAAARETFLAAVHETHRELRTQPGFHGDDVVELCSGPSEYNIVTVVRWADHSALQRARAALQESHARRGFDPPAFRLELGVVADVGNYVPVAAGDR